MTQAVEYTKKVITGVLRGKTEEAKGDKSAITYQVMRDNMKFPDYITLWPDKEGKLTPPDVKVGVRYQWIVQAKPKPSGKGEYLNLVSVDKAAPAHVATPPPASPAPDAPPWPDDEPGSERGTERKTWVKPEAKPERDYATETRQSIEWQTALKAAVDLHQYVTERQDYDAVVAMTLKGAMAMYIVGRGAPKQPEAKGEQHGT